MELREGDLIWVNFSPTKGHEQNGERPALVVSAELFNKSTGLAWVVPITTQRKGLPMEVVLPSGLPITGVLLLAQPRAIDFKARNVRKAGFVQMDFLRDVQARLKAVLS